MPRRPRRGLPALPALPPRAGAAGAALVDQDASACWRSRRRACSTSRKRGRRAPSVERRGGWASATATCAASSSAARRVAAAVPADAPPAHAPSSCWPTRPADHAGGAGQRLRQRAPLQRGLPGALRPEPALRQLRPRRRPARHRQPCEVRLGYRPPYDVARCSASSAPAPSSAWSKVKGARAGAHAAHRSRRPACTPAGCRRRFDERSQLLLRVSDSLRGGAAAGDPPRARAFDLDADPHGHQRRLHGSFPLGDGLRVPGALSGYELAVRAVLGQQITVAAARTLAQRLVRGASASRWPRPSRLTACSPRPRCWPRRAATRWASSASCGSGRRPSSPSRAPWPKAGCAACGRRRAGDVAALKELPGIGDWTAQYIAMRALRWPDAFPAGDVALHKALGVQQSKQPARERKRPRRPGSPGAVMRGARLERAPATPSSEPAATPSPLITKEAS
jgi:3-methyladenine DNA glycosylase/8-oxoguanine DNA glycosylase